MARIRTIKPEFFSSADIVGLSPLARLLYIALWCEADRQGRLVWSPATFKLRYLPGDDIEIEAVAAELLKKGLIVRYGNGLAHIPTFLTHQRVNPRESASVLEAPPVDNSGPVDKSVDNSRVTDASILDVHASNLDLHAQVGRERKGTKYNPPSPLSRGTVDNSTGTSKPSNGKWWETEEATLVEATARGLQTRLGESWSDLRQRIRAAPRRFSDTA